jgi:hypothetical protein
MFKLAMKLVQLVIWTTKETKWMTSFCGKYPTTFPVAPKEFSEISYSWVAQKSWTVNCPYDFFGNNGHGQEKGPLRGHNDMPFRRLATSRPNGRQGVGHPHGIFGVFSYYLLIMLFFNMVCLTVACISMYPWLSWRSTQNTGCIDDVK